MTAAALRLTADAFLLIAAVLRLTVEALRLIAAALRLTAAVLYVDEILNACALP